MRVTQKEILVCAFIVYCLLFMISMLKNDTTVTKKILSNMVERLLVHALRYLLSFN